MWTDNFFSCRYSPKSSEKPSSGYLWFPVQAVAFYCLYFVVAKSLKSSSHFRDLYIRRCVYDVRCKMSWSRGERQVTVKRAKTRLARGLWPEKTADILPRHNWFPRQMTSEKRAQKFHTDDASLPRSGQCFWFAKANFPRGTTNQKHYPGLSSDFSSVWNFCC